MLDCTQKTNKIEQQCINGCEKITYQPATVCVPVKVTPSASAGAVNTFCCGEPTVTPCSCYVLSRGNVNGSCNYTISQNICVEVPIQFNAIACVGDPSVECGRATSLDSSKDIGK